MIWFDFRVLVAIKCNLYIKWNVDNGQIHLTNGKNFKISIFTADQSMENEKKKHKAYIEWTISVMFLVFKSDISFERFV